MSVFMSKIPEPPPFIGNPNKSKTHLSLPTPPAVVLGRDELINELTGTALKEWESFHCLQNVQISGILTVSSLVNPILQQGPMCGLVALEMAAQRFSPGLKSAMFLEEARKNGYTKSGEMFSAAHMAELAASIVHCNPTVVNTEDNENAVHQIVSSIIDGDPVLIPYDADYNHSPALRKGHSAHWALLVGVTLFLDLDNIQTEIIRKESTLQSETQQKPLIVFKESCDISDTDRKSLLESIQHLSKKQVYVNARQGKSKYIGFWNLHSLLKSNRNLKEIAPKITSSSDDFITSNIGITLCSQVVVLRSL